LLLAAEAYFIVVRLSNWSLFRRELRRFPVVWQQGEAACPSAS
jgi:hypothetical protein